MGVLSSLGASSLFGFSFNLQTLGTILLIIGIFVVVLIIAGAGTIGYYMRKAKKIQFKHQIPIFMEVNGKPKRIAIDIARELFVPDSNIGLFFLKNRKIYLPRPTRSMGENEFWYKILDNGEWVNFDLSKDPDKDTLALANYDHRDTRYAYTNLKEIIKRNYSDKAISWWKEYSHIISFILIVFVTIVGIWILISKIGKVLEQLTPLMQQMKDLAEIMKEISINNQNVNSGVVKVS